MSSSSRAERMSASVIPDASSNRDGLWMRSWATCESSAATVISVPFTVAAISPFSPHAKSGKVRSAMMRKVATALR